jgi:hypothetical protein
MLRPLLRTCCGSFFQGTRGDTLVLVGHESVNRMLLTQRIVQNPCCINEIEITGSSFSCAE